MKVLPIFVSHYSGNSILTLDTPEESLRAKEGSDSIFTICQEGKIEDLYLADSNPTGFVEAFKNSKDLKINLHLGITMVVCKNMKEKTPESLNTEHKVTIWANNDSGSKRLFKLTSKAACEGFYYRPRIDCESIKELWSEEDLTLSIPFYYSFLHQNLLHGYNCMPDFSFTQPFFQIENNKIPFNYLLKDAINKWNKSGKYDLVPTKTMYYKKRSDAEFHMAFKCLKERTTLEMPNIDHYCSDEFCFESYLKENV
jgi:DNA polymerase III subunit alpha